MSGLNEGNNDVVALRVSIHSFMSNITDAWLFRKKVPWMIVSKHISRICIGHTQALIFVLIPLLKMNVDAKVSIVGCSVMYDCSKGIAS